MIESVFFLITCPENQDPFLCVTIRRTEDNILCRDSGLKKLWFSYTRDARGKVKNCFIRGFVAGRRVCFLLAEVEDSEEIR